MFKQKIPTQDQLYNLLFSIHYLTEELICMFLGNSNFTPIDPGSLRDCDTVMYSSKTGQERRADIVVSWTCQGVPWVLLLEHQSRPNPRMPFRMLAYTGLLYDKLFDDRSLFVTDNQFAKILLGVIYTGEQDWNYDENFLEFLISLDENFSLSKARIQIKVIDLHRLDPQWLAQQQGVLAAIFRCERSVGLEQIYEQVESLVKVLTKLNDLQLNEAVLRHMVYLLMNRAYGNEFDYSKLESVNTMAQVKRQLEQWVVEDRQRRRQAALTQGKTEGIAEGMRISLAILLEHKFGVQSKGTYLAMLNQVQGVEQLQQLIRWGTDCDTLEELMRKVD